MRVDVAVIGGAFSGAAMALLLRRQLPDLSVVIIERTEHFDRKVGEATTEVSGAFLTKRLGLTHHLANHHIVKHGLRFWFTRGAEQPLDECMEVGAKFQARMPTYQVDRAVLDQHVLDLAVAEGARLLRPAKLAEWRREPDGGNTLLVRPCGEDAETTIQARWVVDASGRAAVAARKFNLLRPLEAHPVNAIWARFRNVGDLDGAGLHAAHPAYAGRVQVSRASATNHLTGYGWWCWIIPLKGGDTSIGLVYDERLYSPPEAPRLVERLQAHLLQNPVGRILCANAVPVEGDVRAYSKLPYYSEQIAGPGWQCVGDAAGFMDPLYSQGLDYASWTIAAALDRIRAETGGETVCLDTINREFLRSYHTWFEALYKDKYHYLGDGSLMTPAFMMDIGLFFFGPVREIVGCREKGFAQFPFNGPVDKFVGRVMCLYNRRLAALGRRRQECGVYGEGNQNRQTYPPSFTPDATVWRIVLRGAVMWLAAEVAAWGLPRRRNVTDPASTAEPTPPGEPAHSPGVPGKF